MEVGILDYDAVHGFVDVDGGSVFVVLVLAPVDNANIVILAFDGVDLAAAGRL